MYPHSGLDKSASALAEAERFDTYILDGRPHSSQQTVDIARAAHAVVIPTGQTKDDLRPAVQLAHSLVAAGIDSSRIAFALVKTTRSAAEISAARSYLEQTDYALLDGELPISTAYGIADDAGKAVTETAYRTLNDKAERLDQAMVDGRIPDFPVTRSHPPASWPSAANSSICRTYRKTAGEESRRRSPVANRWMRP